MQFSSIPREVSIFSLKKITVEKSRKKLQKDLFLRENNGLQYDVARPLFLKRKFVKYVVRVTYPRYPQYIIIITKKGGGLAAIRIYCRIIWPRLN